uniref:CRAL-TRIO domain-containing protein n=1 Tax=Ditylum brightwellii TaxID=49249 RepID=A0A6V2PWX9_9STRA|mmetsp:Transcript_6977/g.9281  ORF Transcript_6977/g.9281 Transcript_6977/m.9281 type:complete len:296 (+) Transcript_6977:98-985(+)
MSPKQPKHNPESAGKSPPKILSSYFTNMIEALKEELSRIPPEQCSSFLKARRRKGLIRKSDLVNFLWNADWDTRFAANKMIQYWDERKRLFGPKFAYLPLTQAGVMRCDNEYLEYKELVHAVKKIDTMNRTLIAINGKEYQRRCKDLTVDSPLRTLWYVINILLKDERVQRNGFVVILDGSEMTDLKVYESLKDMIVQLSVYLPLSINTIFSRQPTVPLMCSTFSVIDGLIPRKTQNSNIRIVEGPKRRVKRKIQKEGILYKYDSKVWSKPSKSFCRGGQIQAIEHKFPKKNESR